MMFAPGTINWYGKTITIIETLSTWTDKPYKSFTAFCYGHEREEIEPLRLPIEFCINTHTFPKPMEKPMGDYSDLVARCAWHSLEMQERVGDADKLPYWVCPQCEREAQREPLQ